MTENIKSANNKKLKIPFYVVIPGLIVFVVVVILNYFIYRQEFIFYKNIYDNEVAGTISLISRRFQSAMIAVESTSAFFNSSDDVTEEEFNLFASQLEKNISSGAISLPVTIEWVDKQGIVRYFYSPVSNKTEIVGIDLKEYPDLFASVEKSKTSKSAVVAEPLELVEGYPGIIIYSPILKNGNYAGAAAVVVRLANLLAPIAGDNPTYNKNVYIQTGNFIIPFDDDVILNNNGERLIDVHGNLVKDSVLAQEYSADNKNVESRDIVFADKTWQIKFSSTYFTEVYKRMTIYIISSILFLVSLILFLYILHRRREQLIKEKAKTEAVVLGVGDGLLVCDKQGTVTFLNKKAEELSGYKIEDVAGKSYYDIWPLYGEKGVRISNEKRPFHEALLKKQVITVSMLDHYYNKRKDGTFFPLAATISPIIVDEEVEGSITVFRDITKESEVDRMKSEFLSLASHQLLTPSSAIKWISELFLDGDLGMLTKKQRENIQNIHTSNESMIGLISSLLNISRIESGRIIVAPKLTSLSDLVGEIAKELKNKIKEKKHTFKIESDKDLPKINIDPNLIKEVYKNLLTNAIKYTPLKGNILVSISKVGNNIVSKVSDNGYGIPLKDKSKIFEKFYRGENITEIEKDGNGLGLYLVKQIIEVSGGKIWFESEINKGTTFIFTLPLSGSTPKEGEVTVVSEKIKLR